MKLENMALAKKIMLGICIPLVLLIVLGTISIVNIKGSRKNNFTFWHHIFRSFLADFKEQKPCNPDSCRDYSAFCSLKSTKPNLNLSAKKVKFFFREP